MGIGKMDLLFPITQPIFSEDLPVNLDDRFQVFLIETSDSNSFDKILFHLVDNA
jgi:hypothetical protein